MADDISNSVFGTKDLQKGEGWVQELQRIVEVAATQLVGHVKVTSDTAGMPWGASKLTNTEAVRRIAEYENPEKAIKFEQLSDGAIISAAIDAIRRRKQAIAKGELDERPAKLDGEDGIFRPATIQPGFVAGIAPVAPPAPVETETPAQAPTSLPAQMALPGLEKAY